jgi:hypothetical protein
MEVEQCLIDYFVEDMVRDEEGVARAKGVEWAAVPSLAPAQPETVSALSVAIRKSIL